MRVNVLVSCPYEVGRFTEMIKGVVDIDDNVAKRWIKEGTAVPVGSEDVVSDDEMSAHTDTAIGESEDEEEDDYTDEVGKPLEKMTVKELREYAEACGFDISEYKKKSDIINAIYKYEDERLAASDLV